MQNDLEPGDYVDYDWLLMHQDEFLSDEECGIINPELLKELMSDEPTD